MSGFKPTIVIKLFSGLSTICMVLNNCRDIADFKITGCKLRRYTETTKRDQAILHCVQLISIFPTLKKITDTDIGFVASMALKFGRTQNLFAAIMQKDTTEKALKTLRSQGFITVQFTTTFRYPFLIVIYTLSGNKSQLALYTYGFVSPEDSGAL